MTDRTTPLGLYNFGVSYLDVARAACRSSHDIAFSDPFEFLLSHGLELILKADLLRTTNLDTIRKDFGHNLQKLRSETSHEFVQHFQLDDDFENVLNYLAIGHSGPNWRNRYIETGSRKAIPIDKQISELKRFDTDDRKWLSKHFYSAAS